MNTINKLKNSDKSIKIIICSLVVVMVIVSGVMFANHNTRNNYWSNVLETRKMITNNIINEEQQKYLIDSKIINDEDVAKINSYKVVRESVDLNKLTSSLKEVETFNNTIVEKINSNTYERLNNASTYLTKIGVSVDSEKKTKETITNALNNLKVDNTDLSKAILFNKTMVSIDKDIAKLKSKVDDRVAQEKAKSQTAGNTTYYGTTTGGSGGTTSGRSGGTTNGRSGGTTSGGSTSNQEYFDPSEGLFYNSCTYVIGNTQYTDCSGQLGR